MPFSLRIDAGSYAGRRYVFDQPEVSLGRTQENDVVVPDDGASRKHARIGQSDGGWQIEDLGSSNGTRVNGEPLKRPLQLRDGDLVQIGAVTFKFSEQQQAPNATRIVAVSDLPQWDRPQTSLARSGGAGALAARSPGGALTARGKGSTPAKAAQRPPMSKPLRLALTAAGAVFGILFLAFLAQKIVGGGRRGPVVADQEFELGQKPDPHYYGQGPDVDVPAPVRALFDFNFSELVPGKSLMTFHCNTDGVAKPEDIEVRINGHHLGYLPATFGDSRPVDWLLDRHQLLVNAENKIEFVNLRHPPANWEVFDLWMEQESLPSGTPEQLQIEAQREYNLAEGRFNSEEVAATNLHDALLHYRRARLVLAAIPVPPGPPGPLLSLVTERLHEAQNKLDKRCHAMLFTAQQALATKGTDDALDVLHDILNYFPTDDHPCNEKAHKLIQQYE
ncbi:MAG: FHA domain-containing protein [Myxococcales bacterium]